MIFIAAIFKQSVTSDIIYYTWVNKLWSKFKGEHNIIIIDQLNTYQSSNILFLFTHTGSSNKEAKNSFLHKKYYIVEIREHCHHPEKDAGSRNEINKLINSNFPLPDRNEIIFTEMLQVVETQIPTFFCQPTSSNFES